MKIYILTVKKNYSINDFTSLNLDELLSVEV